MANKVELYNNGVLIGTDNAPTVNGTEWTYSIPYTATSGNDVLTAKAFVDDVEVASSGVRNVVVNAAGASTLLLDQYPGASVAFGLIKLRDAYTGSAIRVRNTSTSAETDIGFDVNGDLDLTALNNASGGATLLVVTWYDQSGNDYHTSIASFDAPRIIANGNIDTVNGFPAIRALPLKRISRTTATQLVNPITGAWSAFGVGMYNSIGGADNYFLGHDGSVRIAHMLRSNLTEDGGQAIHFQTDGTAIINNSPSNTAYYDELIVQTAICTGTTLEAFVNGTGNGSTAISNPRKSADTFDIFARGNNSNNANTEAYGAVMIVYPDDKTSDKAGIESFLQNKYGL